MNSFPLDHCLKLRLLGGFDVRLNDLSIGGFYNKMRALLAYLALEREQDHSRDMLAELLWGEHDRQAARDNLRRTLANLRSALETPSGLTLFTASKNAIRFSPNAYIDVLDFNGQRLTAEANLGGMHKPRRAGYRSLPGRIVGRPELAGQSRFRLLVTGTTGNPAPSMLSPYWSGYRIVTHKPVITKRRCNSPYAIRIWNPGTKTPIAGLCVVTH